MTSRKAVEFYAGAHSSSIDEELRYAKNIGEFAIEY